MDVDDPSKLGPFPMSGKKFSPEGKKRRVQMDTYTAVMKSTIIFKISSGFEVSSNPGVSMRVTVLLSRVNSPEGWILVLVARG